MWPLSTHRDGKRGGRAWVAVARGWQHVGEGARRSGAGAPSSTPARLRRGREAPHGPRAMDDTGGIDVDAIARKAVNGLNKAWGWLSGEDQAKAVPARTGAPGRAHTSPASDQQVHGSYPTQQQWGQHHQQQQEQQPPQPATYASPTYSPPSLSPQASVNASWSAAPPAAQGTDVPQMPMQQPQLPIQQRLMPVPMSAPEALMPPSPLQAQILPAAAP